MSSFSRFSEDRGSILVLLKNFDIHTLQFTLHYNVSMSDKPSLEHMGFREMPTRDGETSWSRRPACINGTSTCQRCCILTMIFWVITPCTEMFVPTFRRNVVPHLPGNRIRLKWKLNDWEWGNLFITEDGCKSYGQSELQKGKKGYTAETGSYNPCNTNPLPLLWHWVATIPEPSYISDTLPSPNHFGIHQKSLQEAY